MIIHVFCFLYVEFNQYTILSFRTAGKSATGVDLKMFGHVLISTNWRGVIKKKISLDSLSSFNFFYWVNLSQISRPSAVRRVCKHWQDVTIIVVWILIPILIHYGAWDTRWWVTCFLLLLDQSICPWPLFMCSMTLFVIMCLISTWIWMQYSYVHRTWRFWFLSCISEILRNDSILAVKIANFYYYRNFILFYKSFFSLRKKKFWNNSNYLSNWYLLSIRFYEVC